jgi:hypothetical protein
MKARRVPGCLHVHVEVDQIHQNLYVPLRLLIATHNAERQPRLAILHDEGWDDRVIWPLAGLDAVGMLQIEDEEPSPVLEHDAGVPRRDPRAEACVQALNERHHVPPAVSHCEVDRVPTFRNP